MQNHLKSKSHHSCTEMRNLGFRLAGDNPKRDSRAMEAKHILSLKRFLNGDTQALSDFSGLGGCFLERGSFQRALASLLTPQEMALLPETIKSAYFTPADIVKHCWAIVAQLGLQGGKILEPSCGMGHFFAHMPQSIKQQSEITGIELDLFSAKVARKLYPAINIHQGRYEEHTHQGYDLIIGNPPYGCHSVKDKQFSDLNHLKIHHAFLARSIRLLKDNGLCVLVLPTYCMDSPRGHARQLIQHEASLLFACRLPDNIFEGAKVTTDIVVLQKKKPAYPEWLELAEIELMDGFTDALSRYYIAHPRHILGKLDSYDCWLQEKQRMRRGMKVVGTLAEVNNRLPALVQALKPVFASQHKPAKSKSSVQSLLQAIDKLKQQVIEMTANA